MTQQEAYAAGFNQTADLRFVLRDEPAPFTMHTPIGGPPQVRKVRILQQRYVRRLEGYGGQAEEIWLDVPLYTGEGSND